MRKTYLIAASFIAMAFAPAFALADDCNQSSSCSDQVMTISNDQNQNATIKSFNNVNLGYSQDTSVSGLSAGNSLSVKNQNTTASINSNQVLDGNVYSKNNISIDSARGTTVSTSVAQGNAGQSQGCCSYTGTNINQNSGNGNNIAATSYMNLKSADTVVSASQAAGNNWATAVENGSVYNNSGQYGTANVKAASVVEACCNNNSVTSSAVAAGNNLALAGKNATINTDFQQMSGGNVSSYSGVLDHSATNVTSVANSIGNNGTISNEYGYVGMNGYQANGGNISSRSEVNLDNWYGSAVSAASSTGNGALVSNIGSDVGMSNYQQNSGNVASMASLVGSSSSGGVGVVSSTAVGNTITGYSCATCSATGSVNVNGVNQQYNSGNVTAVNNVNVGYSGGMSISSSAIGNSATYIAQKN